METRFGIPDDEFLRGSVPMTKSEVRAVVLSKLQIQKGMTCLDVGCGTGSVTVEMALAAGEEGLVYGLDQNPEAVILTMENTKRFGLKQVRVLQGKAPEELPEVLYDRIFAGGGGKSLEDILTFAEKQLAHGGILVVTAILVETLANTLRAMEELGFEKMGCVCLNVAVGEKISGWMMKANNPIYIIWGEKS